MQITSMTPARVDHARLRLQARIAAPHERDELVSYAVEPSIVTTDTGARLLQLVPTSAAAERFHATPQGRSFHRLFSDITNHMVRSGMRPEAVSIDLTTSASMWRRRIREAVTDAAAAACAGADALSRVQHVVDAQTELAAQALAVTVGAGTVIISPSVTATLMTHEYGDASAANDTIRAVRVLAHELHHTVSPLDVTSGDNWIEEGATDLATLLMGRSWQGYLGVDERRGSQMVQDLMATTDAAYLRKMDALRSIVNAAWPDPYDPDNQAAILDLLQGESVDTFPHRAAKALAARYRLPPDKLGALAAAVFAVNADPERAEKLVARLDAQAF